MTLARVVPVINVGRAAASAAAGAVLGAAQYGVGLAGMHRAAATKGLAGLGVAAGYAAGWLAMSLFLLCLACGVLQLRWWAFAALTLLAGELLVMGFVWRFSAPFGLHGDHRATFFIPAAVAVVTAGGLRWQRREPRP